MKRYFLVPLLLFGLLNSIHLLPKHGEFYRSSIVTQPPLRFGSWEGQRTLPSKAEMDILAKDTSFEKALYLSEDHPTITLADGKLGYAIINLSIVNSGSDINNSIHRPERCLVAQGHLGMTQGVSTVTSPNKHRITLRQLLTRLPIGKKEDGTPAKEIGFLSYYFFVGNQQMTYDHTRRTVLDMKDRILRGKDQQWSFIMLSIPFDLSPSADTTKANQEKADQKIRELVGELADRIVKWDEIKVQD